MVVHPWIIIYSLRLINNLRKSSKGAIKMSHLNTLSLRLEQLVTFQIVGVFYLDFINDKKVTRSIQKISREKWSQKKFWKNWTNTWGRAVSHITKASLISHINLISNILRIKVTILPRRATIPRTKVIIITKVKIFGAIFDLKYNFQQRKLTLTLAGGLYEDHRP